jgi:plasmid stability protein
MKKATTIFVDDGLWEKFKIRAIKKHKSCSQLLEEVIKKELKR